MLPLAHLRSLADFAERFGDGRIDITARANIQLRGIAPDRFSAFAQTVSSTDLLPSASHDRARNIVTSPFAGVDSRELLDSRPLVRELDERLSADPHLIGLPSKFLFAIDGGARPFNADGADLALHAVATSEGIRFHLAIGGRLSGFGVTADSAGAALIDAARAALSFAELVGAPQRSWRLRKLPGAHAEVLKVLGSQLRACPTPKNSMIVATIPPGIHSAHHPDFVNVVPSIPLGRLEAREARAIADLAERIGADLRLASWRGIVLGAVPRRLLPETSAELERLRLTLDDSAGYAGIAACAGIEGCTAALADVRSDASKLAHRLARLRQSTNAEARADWTVNFAACDKRCAMRRGASVEFVATQTGYDVSVNGLRVRAAATAEDALEIAATEYSFPKIPA
jgi:sulfite reductase beta subunit-like hemoprotein